MIEMGVVCEEIGRALYPGPFASSALGAVSALLAAGGEGVEGDLLRELAEGTRVGVVALHESQARYDGRAPATTASAGGQGWRVSGVKSPVADAALADVLIVSARAASDDVALFVVEAGEGVAVEPLASVDGTRPLARVTLRETQARRIGNGPAAAAIETLLDRIAVGLVADGLGAAGRVFELAAAYAHERHQFGKPIGSFQAVQHLLVDMLQDLELARAAGYYALWAADAASPVERHRAATMAKAFASRALPEIGDGAIQVFAGVGFTWEHDAHLFYKRLLTMQHLCGDEGAHLDELARLAIDAPSADEPNH
jgi:alkylation response protein AidB-like acyl-CoA dehydrogenase